ncbi:hypothetical protein ACIRU3_25945 [Streptomyces sp. NPDC101151]|uniref:hypothetical protein n=1 Tax=Streptomyces sp. NPDC101151 TaxID=3366115 RepID=UPI0038235E7D
MARAAGEAHHLRTSSLIATLPPEALPADPSIVLARTAPVKASPGPGRDLPWAGVIPVGRARLAPPALTADVV